MRACRFSSVRSGSRPSNVRRERAGERLDHRLDRDLAEVDAERLGEPLRVAARPLRRVARRHRDAVHALRAERLDAERGGERRVDAAGEPDHDVAEAVLRHVVAQPELEREPHLLEVVELRGDACGCAASRLRAAAARARSRRHVGAAALARERAAAHVAQPPADRRDRVDVDDEQLLLEARRRARAPRPRRRARPSGRRRSARPGRRRRCRARRSTSCRARAPAASPRARGPCRRGTARPRCSRRAARRRARARSQAAPGCQMSSQIVGPTRTSPNRSRKQVVARARSSGPRRRRRSSAGSACGRRSAPRRARARSRRCRGRRRGAARRRAR